MDETTKRPTPAVSIGTRFAEALGYDPVDLDLERFGEAVRISMVRRSSLPSPEAYLLSCTAVDAGPARDRPKVHGIIVAPPRPTVSVISTPPGALSGPGRPPALPMANWSRDLRTPVVARVVAPRRPSRRYSRRPLLLALLVLVAAGFAFLAVAGGPGLGEAWLAALGAGACLAWPSLRIARWLDQT